jgi:hypothetical protein
MPMFYFMPMYPYNNPFHLRVLCQERCIKLTMTTLLRSFSLEGVVLGS